MTRRRTRTKRNYVNAENCNDHRFDQTLEKATHYLVATRSTTTLTFPKIKAGVIVLKVAPDIGWHTVALCPCVSSHRPKAL